MQQASMDMNRASLSEHVYRHVKERLLDGRFGADKWIPIDDITRTLGVSRQPVMAALKRLALEGLAARRAVPADVIALQ